MNLSLFWWTLLLVDGFDALRASLASAPVLPRGAIIEVLNKDVVGGRSLLDLDDWLAGAELPGRPQVVVLFATSPTECAESGEGLCKDLESLVAPKILVVGIVLPGIEEVSRVKNDLVYSKRRYPLTLDPHGMLAHTLLFRRPGDAVVIHSKGEVSRIQGPQGLGVASARRRWKGEVERAVREIVRKDEEER